MDQQSRHIYEQQTSSQQDQDAEQYNVGQFVDASSHISELDQLESYQQKNDYLVSRTKMKPGGLSAWQRKQAKSAGICVVCSDKSSGWHYNVQVNFSRKSYRGQRIKTYICHAGL